MVLDPRTGGLLLGGSNGAGLVIERHTATGAGNTSWGAGGERVYNENKTNLTIASITALPHNRVLLAFKREQQRSRISYTPDGRRGGADDVALLMLDRHGSYDRTFNGGHSIRLSAASYAQTQTQTANDDRSIITTTRVEDFSTPTFGDIQFRADGGLRVIVTRLAAHATTVDLFNHNGVEPNDSSTTSSRFVSSVESTAVSPDGVLVPRKSQAYVLRHRTNPSTYFSSTIMPAMSRRWPLRTMPTTGLQCWETLQAVRRSTGDIWPDS